MVPGNFQQVMPVSTRTGATAPHLDTKSVVENPYAQVVVQTIDVKGNHAQAITVPVGQNVQVRDGFEAIPNEVKQFVLALKDVFNAHLSLELHAKGYPHGL